MASSSGPSDLPVPVNTQSGALQPIKESAFGWLLGCWVASVLTFGFGALPFVGMLLDGYWWLSPIFFVLMVGGLAMFRHLARTFRDERRALPSIFLGSPPQLGQELEVHWRFASAARGLTALSMELRALEHRRVPDNDEPDTWVAWRGRVVEVNTSEACSSGEARLLLPDTIPTVQGSAPRISWRLALQLDVGHTFEREYALDAAPPAPHAPPGDE